MRKHHNIISKYFSLLSNQIHDVNEFGKQIDFWIESDAKNIYYEALTDDFLRPNLISFPKKIIQSAYETRNITNFYLKGLHSSLADLRLLMKIELRENN
jgi:hypothetical protein